MGKRAISDRDLLTSTPVSPLRHDLIRSQDLERARSTTTFFTLCLYRDIGGRILVGHQMVFGPGATC